MAITATFEVVRPDNKTNRVLEENPDNDILGIPSRTGTIYMRNPAFDALAEEAGGRPKVIRATFEVLEIEE